MNLGKVRQLASVAWEHPSEFVDRVAAIAQARLERLVVRAPPYDPTDLNRAIREVDVHFGHRAERVLDEPALEEIEAGVLHRIRSAADRGPFSPAHNADLTLARCCYVVCRLARPAVAVETGVAYGVSSAFILAALEQNRSGTLLSIDLPPLGRHADQHVGIVVPPELRRRWRLHRGTSRRLLPALLDEVGQVGLFLHDSLHTYLNIRRELRMVWDHLTPLGIVVADDIEGNRAFGELKTRGPRFWGTVRETGKGALFGIAVK